MTPEQEESKIWNQFWGKICSQWLRGLPNRGPRAVAILHGVLYSQNTGCLCREKGDGDGRYSTEIKKIWMGTWSAPWSMWIVSNSWRYGWSTQHSIEPCLLQVLSVLESHLWILAFLSTSQTTNQPLNTYDMSNSYYAKCMDGWFMLQHQDSHKVQKLHSADTWSRYEMLKANWIHT